MPLERILTILRQKRQFLSHLLQIQIIFMELQSVVPNKSPNDERQYQAFQLPNNLKLLLISDPKAEKAACSISVNVGSLKDGQRSLGLAHFLQHMLFMGSRKFVKHNEYSQFMSLNSGYDNAYTADDQTNYHFEIANAKFQEAVERLCDFFVKALLTDSCIEKQRQAVHEQCMLRFGQDNSRKWQILKHFANGPYHNHSIGNNSTLNHPDVSEDLNNFYNNQYSANRISAVLLSALPLNEVKQKVIMFFQEIQNKKLPHIEYVPHFLQTSIGKMVQMQSIKDEVIMQFFFAVQSTRLFYKWHPEKYITHVLGHQGKHSLLSFLKQNDWASKLVSYSHDLPKQTIFGVQVQLTEKGEADHEQVYNFVINYIESVKAERHIYEQLKQASAVSFKYKEKGSNINYVTQLSCNMHRIPLPEILTYKYQYAEFNQNVINNIIGQLNPANLIVVYSNSQQLENPITQKHLGGKFVIRNLPNYSKLETNFSALIKNPFLPLSTDLVNSQILTPIKENGIWFVQGQFKVCKGGIRLKANKVQSQIFLEFYANYLDLLLKQITYEAQTLKLEVQIQSQDCFAISIYGFSHTVQKLLQQIAPLIRKEHHSQQGERLFRLTLEDLKEEYENFYEGQVDQIVDQLLKIILKSRGTTVGQRMEELDTYDYTAISNRIDEFWKAARLQWIVVGNFDKQQVTQLIKTFEKVLGTSQTGLAVQNKCMKLKRNDNGRFICQLQSQDIGTSGVIVYKEIGEYTQNKYYTLSLLKNYIQQPFFDQLRTQKQLAYYLRAYQQNISGVLSLCYLLISSNSDPYQVSNHIKTFIDEFLSKMEEDLTQQKFQSLKKSLTSKTLQPFNSLHDYFEFICRQIDRGTLCFDRKTNATQLHQYLEKISREDLINMLKQSLSLSLQVWVVAEPHKKNFSKRKIKGLNAQEIRSNHEFYEDITLKLSNEKEQ